MALEDVQAWIAANHEPIAWWRLGDDFSSEYQGDPWVEAVEALAPTSWWRLGEATGSTVVVDEMGANTGAVTTGSGTGFGSTGLLTSGDADTAYNSQGGRIAVPHFSEMEAASGFTVNVWVKPSATVAAEDCFISCRSGTNGVNLSGFDLRSSGANTFYAIAFGDETFTLRANNTTIPMTLSTTVMFTVVRTATQWLIYANGVLNTTVTDGYSPPLTADLVFGRFASDGSRNWDGIIDEPQWFDDDLDAAQVLELFRAGKYNRTRTGTVTGATLGVDPLTHDTDPDNAISFDGVNDFVSIPYEPELNPAIFSVALWVKPDDLVAGTQGIIGTSPSTNGFMLFRQADILQIQTGNGTGVNNTSAGSQLAAGVPVHIVCGYDGTNAFIIVNGDEKVRTARTFAVNPSAAIWFARYDAAYFPGDIDEAMLFNVALTEAQALSLMSAQMAAPALPTIFTPPTEPTTPTFFTQIALANGATLSEPATPEQAAISQEANTIRVCTLSLNAEDPGAPLLVRDIGEHFVRIQTTDGIDVFHGQTWDYEINSEGVEERISILCVDPWMNLDLVFTDQLDTLSWEGIDQGLIIKDIIDQSDCRIRTDEALIELTQPRDRNWIDNPISCAAAIQSFTTLTNPIDIHLRPIPMTEDGEICELVITARDSASVELAISRGDDTLDNAASMQARGGLSTTRNEILGIGDAGLNQRIQNAVSFAKYGRLGETRTWGSVRESNTLQGHIQRRLSEKANPVARFDAGLETVDDLAFIDFVPTDLANARLSVGNGALNFVGRNNRIIACELTIDSAGARTTGVSLDDGQTEVEEATSE